MMQIMPDLFVQIDGPRKSKIRSTVRKQIHRRPVLIWSEAHDVLKFRVLYLAAESVKPNQVLSRDGSSLNGRCRLVRTSWNSRLDLDLLGCRQG